MTTLAAVEPKLIGDKYRVVALLGQGAMGVVYRAEQLDVEGHVLREVALKTMRPEFSRDPDFSKRFLREVRVAARLRSAHTVTIYDSGRDDIGQLFYTMEIIKGQTLKEILQSQGTLSVERVVRIVSQVCDALAEAHGLPEPIVHRDIKPANIFLEEHQGEDRVKVGDFGIAKVLGEETSNLSHTGVSPGTPRYMAPEQWRGEVIDARSDLYALGVMTYEMFTGGAPFVATDGPMALMYQHLEGAPRPLPDAIPVGIRLQVEKMLAKAPQQRPANATIIRRAFEQALASSEEGQRTILLPAQNANAEQQGRNGIVSTRGDAPQNSSSTGNGSSSSLGRFTLSYDSPTSSEKKEVGISARTVVVGGLIAVAVVGGGLWYWPRQIAAPQQSQTIAVTDPAHIQAKPPLREVDADLIAAARTGSPELVQTLVEKGANVNAKDDTGRTALMWAANNGASDMVQFLLSKGAEVNAKDPTGKTALLWTTSRPLDRFTLVQTLADTVQMLLTHGADAMVSDADGKTPLIWAALNGYDTIVRILLAKNASPDGQDKEGNTALLFAARNDRIDVVRLLLTKGALIDSQNAEGTTPLMAAATAGYLNIANALLAKNAELNLKDTEGRTALMWAANSGSPDIVQALLSKGADPTLINKGGRNAVMVAALKGQANILQLLLTKGVDINATDENGKTALMWAAIETHLDCVQVLLAKGATANNTDKEGKSALLWIAAQDYVDLEIEKSSADIVQVLLAKGADIRQKSDEGKTALLWAAEKGHISIVQALLAKKADPQVKDRSGKSALMLANEGNHPEIAKLLRTAGAQE
jgi:ankyrin repeat protein/serine/threonine protein kinase